MHGSIQLVIATEADRLRRADADRARSRAAHRRSFVSAVAARLLPGRAAAQGIPTRAAPGLGHHHTPAAPPLRAR